MSSKAEKEKQKLIQEKCQGILNDLLRDEDNKYCVDCDAKGPRWASWNLGIFLCIRCAGIHRNLGVHISKVKSVNLDTWTPEQVVTLQQMGNSRARAVYEANLPDSFRRPQHDSSLEGFIRSKYEQKKYIAKEWVPPVIPKVNWDREIEESRKKKEGKRKIGGVSLPAPELHGIPKPKSPNSTPKPVRAAATIAALDAAEAEKKAAAASPAPSSGAIDLLGLDNPSPAASNNGNGGDDVFTSFLSAPPAAEPATTNEEAGSGRRTAEEDSFFNQPSVSQEKKPLTKDSIMALYSQGGTQQAPQPQLFGIQGGIFTQPSFPAAQPNFPTTQSSFPTSQPSFPTAQSSFPAAQANFPAAQPMGGMGGFPGAGATNGVMGGGQVAANMAPCGTVMPQNGMFAGVQPSMGMASNPFFASSPFQGMPSAGMQLPQQMARMNLGGVQPNSMGALGNLGGLGGLGTAPSAGFGGGPFAGPPSTGHTLSTNLWQ